VSHGVHTQGHVLLAQERTAGLLRGSLARYAGGNTGSHRL
jgi:hypothetical protein